MEDQVDGCGMVFNKKPVADIFSLSVNRNRFVVFDIIDGKRDQFFRELVWPVIVGTVGNDNREVCRYGKTP